MAGYPRGPSPYPASTASRQRAQLYRQPTASASTSASTLRTSRQRAELSTYGQIIRSLPPKFLRVRNFNFRRIRIRVIRSTAFRRLSIKTRIVRPIWRRPLQQLRRRQRQQPRQRHQQFQQSMVSLEVNIGCRAITAPARRPRRPPLLIKKRTRKRRRRRITVSNRFWNVRRRCSFADWTVSCRAAVSRQTNVPLRFSSTFCSSKVFQTGEDPEGFFVDGTLRRFQRLFHFRRRNFYPNLPFDVISDIVQIVGCKFKRCVSNIF